MSGSTLNLLTLVLETGFSPYSRVGNLILILLLRRSKSYDEDTRIKNKDQSMTRSRTVTKQTALPKSVQKESRSTIIRSLQYAFANGATVLIRQRIDDDTIVDCLCDS